MDKQQRIEFAQQLAINPLYQEFLSDFKAALFNRWLASKTVEEREEIHRLAVTSDAFTVQVRSFLADKRKEEESNV